jgi:NTE family protein
MRALVLSGGGCKGAYEVGAIEYLCGNLENKYDVICGVSVGALNGSFLSQYPVGKEKLASEALGKLWDTIDDKKIYKHWFGWYLASLWKSSVYDSKPLQDLVRSKLDVKAVKNSGKKLCVGAANLVTGEYKIFDENYHDIAGAVLASSSFPGMLCPIELDGQLWTDGGVRDITPLKAAINLGADEIDVVVCSPNFVDKSFPKKPNVLSIMKRSIEIMSDEIDRTDLNKAMLYNDLVSSGVIIDKRNIPIRIIRPNHHLTNNSLDFSPKLLKEMREIGYFDAKKICSS